MRQKITFYILWGLIIGLLYNIFLYHSLGLFGIINSLLIFCVSALLYGFFSNGVDFITRNNNRTFKKLIKPAIKSGGVFIICWLLMRGFFNAANQSDKF